MTGDWDRSLKALDQLVGTVRRAAERATKKNATIARDEVKRSITRGNPDWPPLKQATIKRKGSSKPLIDKGDLRNSITFEVVTPYSAFIGVLRTATRKDNSKPLVNIARVHEYGFMGMVTNPRTGTTYFLRIPPRPFLEPTLNRIKMQLFNNWSREVAAEVKASV